MTTTDKWDRHVMREWPVLALRCPRNQDHPFRV